ncbi:hypothetical protein OGAPHI_001903 [Ogataea philodendri]|uniref:Patatin-like phospholipase domain-containing protein n=1 Tax=Ogataea philodendri TaxID=1378263 RepID=A0A9P8T763_9ASCO|nr:uncharacterized protein OGAPHI_001903 [Ogataea philodendri]KAH3668149.1 hypothetical protein OGAPHI_001903 [Ogataea philodendri]
MGDKEMAFDQNANPYENITERLITKRVSELEASKVKSASIYTLVLQRIAKILRDVPLIKHCIGPPDEVTAQINKLIAQQKAATSYREWYDTSVKLDTLMEKEAWKNEDDSPLYDYQLVQVRLQELRDARMNNDYSRLLYLIRTTWSRNMANMDNINLYRHSFVGTKFLIEEYISECQRCLQCLTSEKCPLDDKYILAMLMQTRKNYGRVAITMSGGSCFGMLGMGVFSTLLELDLLPKIVSGSSSGSILSSVICSKTTPELLALLQSITSSKFEVFSKDDEPDTFLTCLGRLLKYGTWFDNSHLKSTMQEILGDLTFRGAYNRTGRILNITVSPASVHEQPTLLNYLTAPNVLIWSAVCASCSLPGIFASSAIYEKNVKTGEVQEWSDPMVKFVDGSVHSDLPIRRLSEMFNVNHVIACQVNPHVVPFLKMSVQCVGGEIENEYSAKLKQLFNGTCELLSAEAMHYLELSAELGLATNFSTKMRQILSQPYSGDITILPEIRLTEMNKLLVNPTPEFLLDALVRGARATWPKVSIIKNHCSLEFSLDKAIAKIRSRLISNPSRQLEFLPVSLIQHGEPVFQVQEQKPRRRRSHQRRRSESLTLGAMAEQRLRSSMVYSSHKPAATSTPLKRRVYRHPSFPTLNIPKTSPSTQPSQPGSPQSLKNRASSVNRSSSWLATPDFSGSHRNGSSRNLLSAPGSFHTANESVTSLAPEQQIEDNVKDTANDTL